MGKEESTFFKDTAAGRTVITPVDDPIPKNILVPKTGCHELYIKKKHGVGIWSMRRSGYWRSHGKVCGVNMIKTHFKNLSNFKKGLYKK